jgi:hypothetical protein
VHVFVLTIGYSRRGWAEGYEKSSSPRCWRRTSMPSRTLAADPPSCSTIGCAR